MARLVPTTPYYSVFEDLLEHLFRPEIQYLYAEEDVPNLIELRDVFCFNKDGGPAYVVYLMIGNTKGFIELDPAQPLGAMAFLERDVTKKETQTEAKEYLLSLISSESSNDNDDNS